ncbi:MAG TPA: hypothetical protein VGL72_03910, partial [Bryobacteraceae bacterium]
NAIFDQRFGALITANRNGLPCGNGEQTAESQATWSEPIGQSYQPPSVIDMHAYVCLADDGTEGNPFGWGSCRIDKNGGLYARTEAIATFNDLLALERARGWPSTTRLVIGETHSPTSNTTGQVLGGFVSNPMQLPETCESAAANTPRAMVVGIRQSSLNNSQGGVVIRPFNVTGDSCYDVPAQVISNGYDITQK